MIISTPRRFSFKLSRSVPLPTYRQILEKQWDFPSFSYAKECQNWPICDSDRKLLASSAAHYIDAIERLDPKIRGSLAHLVRPIDWRSCLFGALSFWIIFRFPVSTRAWYVLSHLSGFLFRPLTPWKVDRVQYRIVHLTTGIYEGQTLKPSGVKLREEVLRATAEKDIDIEQMSRRRQHDAHNDPLLFLPKAIPDTHLLILSSGSYDFSAWTSITKFYYLMV